MRHALFLSTQSLVLATSLALAGCTSDDTNQDAADETDSACEGDGVLRLNNMTGNTIEVLHFRACDMSDQHDFPVPPPGLATGESADIPFPGPGCWVIEYEGEGCFSAMDEMPPELACGEVHVWDAGEDNHICQG